MAEIQETIRGFIAKNKIEKALDVLIDWSTTHKDFDLRDGFITLKARLERVKQQERLGILNYTEALREQAFLSSSVLDMTQRLTEDIEINEKQEDGVINPARKTILFLASSPTDLAKLQLDKEFVRISSSLQEGAIEYRLKAEWAVTANQLQQAILKHKPNFVHFSGHGEGGDLYLGGIFLQNSEAKAHLVPGAALENLFKIFAKKLDIQIVLLNACYSEEQALAISKHIPFVIGMNSAISDNAAIEFSTGFYRGLAEEEDISFAFDLAVNMIQLQGLGDSDLPVFHQKASE